MSGGFARLTPPLLLPQRKRPRLIKSRTLLQTALPQELFNHHNRSIVRNQEMAQGC